MNFIRKCNTNLFLKLNLVRPCPNIIQFAFMKEWAYPDKLEHIALPDKLKRKLPILERVPVIPPNIRAPKSQKRLIDIRGPELVHNKLIYNQYGIIALSGTQLKIGHIEMMRNAVNKAIDISRMFAVWRIDAPWKPRTKKGQGKRMGGGKGAIDHYVTPIKAGRIILEMGGKAELSEVSAILQQIICKLPCDAMIVTKQIMDDLLIEEQQLQRLNINPFSFEYVVRNRMQGCHSWIRKYDKIWFNKYI